MKTVAEFSLEIVELCGRISVLAECQKWGDIQDLLTKFGKSQQLDALRSAAAVVANAQQTDINNSLGAQSILALADKIEREL